jgi:hypothetical protein
VRRRESRTENGVPQYRCTRCGDWKAVGGFYPLPWQLMPYSRCGIRSACKACENAERVRLRRLRAGEAT